MHWQLYTAHYITNPQKSTKKNRRIHENLYMLASSQIPPQQFFGSVAGHQPLTTPVARTSGGETATFQFFPGRPARHLGTKQWFTAMEFSEKFRCRCLENDITNYSVKWKESPGVNECKNSSFPIFVGWYWKKLDRKKDGERFSSRRS